MKYVNFTKHPLFMPMYNPVEMLQMGVFGGTAFKYETQLHTKYPKIPWGSVSYGFPWESELNHYKVPGYHFTHVLPQKGLYFKPLSWFEWYTEFYYNHNKGPRDNHRDYYFISNWAHYISLIYETKATEITTCQPPLLQALLEMGYDGLHQPNFKTSWMQMKLPLRRYQVG